MVADMQKEGYVIVGGSAAGLSAAQSIRETDRMTPVTIISDEPFAYSRIAIAKYLTGDVVRKKISLVENGFYRKNNVRTLFGKRVVAIVPRKKQIVLENGEEISYTKLLLATGSQPSIPRISGIDKEGVFTFWTLRDVENIARFLAEGSNYKRGVVIGGGLIGFQAALALARFGLKVCVVEKLPTIFPQILDKESVKIVKQKLDDMGIEIITGAHVTGISGDERVREIEVDRKRAKADIVISAAGVRPNILPVEGNRLKIARGIIVDEWMRTSERDIFAAGDVAETFDVIDGQRKIMAIWPNAIEGGRVAGHNMSCVEQMEHKYLLMNSLHIGNLYVVTLGLSWVEDEENFHVAKHCDIRRGLYRKLVCRDHRLVGAILVGEIQVAGFLRTLMQKGENAEPFLRPILEGQGYFGSFYTDLPRRKSQEFLGKKFNMSDLC